MTLIYTFFVYHSSHFVLVAMVGNIYKPQEILIHPKYARNVRDQHDIALVKLRREVRFNRLQMPICLPQTAKFQDTNLTAVRLFEFHPKPIYSGGHY